MIKEGDKAIPFELMGDDGQKHALKHYLGHWVVLYFYPKDMTPGCTTEACEFNDAISSYSDLDAVILGVSADSVSSHVQFKSRYGLEFVLLSDPNHTVHKQYGAYGEKNLYGKISVGALRTTVVIDPKGHIVKIWRKVRAKGHAQSVLGALTSWQS